MSQPVPSARLVAVRDAPLSVDEVLAAVSDPRAGAIVPFIGIVRDHDSDKGVTSLDYSGHPTALDRLAEVVAGTQQLPGVLAAAAVHRVGHLEIGDLAVVCAVSASHRGQAFDACRHLIDTLKSTIAADRVPIPVTTRRNPSWLTVP